MSNDNANASGNSSFSHAFLPGLILGLIIGAVAGAFLPDFLGGSKIPVNTNAHSTPSAGGSRDRAEELPDDGIIDDAQNQAEEAAEDIQDAANEAAQDLEENLPTDPPSDG